MASMETELTVQPLVGHTDDPRALEESSNYDIVIATPGKAFNAIYNGKFPTKPLQYLVFDEAHDLLSGTGAGLHAQRVWDAIDATTKESLVRIIISNVPLQNARKYIKMVQLVTLRALYITGKWELTTVPFQNEISEIPADVTRCRKNTREQNGKNIPSRYLFSSLISSEHRNST